MKRRFLDVRISQYACLVGCLLLMLVVAVAHGGKLFGVDLSKGEDEAQFETMRVADDGAIVVNTTEIGKNIIGFAGPTPVEIQIRDDKISKIRILPNDETPEFLGAVLNSDLASSLDGLTLSRARGRKIDAVTGATYTSNAVIQNIHMGIYYALDNGETEAPETGNAENPINAKFFVTLAIILCGAVIPLCLRNRNYRLIQLILNVALLGFWGGAFLSYSLMVSAVTNGLWRVALIPVALMLVTAFVYPMFGKANHYCNWICPYGSLQELAGRCRKKKISLSPKAVRRLTRFRLALWFALMWLLWTGLWFDWMGYEPFAAFFIVDASPVVIGIAGAFVLLSFFVNRPYCRFVCPTGSLFKLSEGSK